MATTASVRRIAIDPVSRVEGHGKVTLLLDEHNRVTQARLHIVEFRGFERFIRGRLYWEAPLISERLCGICPVSHHLAAAKAMDEIAGIDRITPTAEKMRRLMHYGQILQSHATHFFYLAAPDLVLGFDADPAVRNMAGIVRNNPEFAKKGILIRKFGQELIGVTSGKRIHGTGAIPGGINKFLTFSERAVFLESLPSVERWTRESLEYIRDYIKNHFGELHDFGRVPSSHMCIVRPDGALDLYDGMLRAVDAEGKTIFDSVPAREYARYIAEEVKEWSYMKFPFIKSIGPADGWYRVGPLSRMNVCSYLDTPKADAARRELFSFAGKPPLHSIMLIHWARAIEMLYAVEKIGSLLADPDVLRGDILAHGGKRRENAVAAIEAPRGTLFHQYQVGSDDLIQRCNLIVSTTQNNEAMNQSVRVVAQKLIDGKARITEGLLNRIEIAIRAYDPCLSCATHAIGAMPLIIELIDCRGRIIDKRTRP